MKITISYPPAESKKGIALLAQNRQFQWANTPWTAYPMVPASAASLLKREGFEVFWDDAVNEGLNYENWKRRILAEKPDVVAIEAKTPVIKKYWKVIDGLKAFLPDTRVVLMGDHVTALPEESLQNCLVDYVLTGGDFDFLLLNLANHLTKGQALESGWYFREDGKVKNTGRFSLKHDLNSLPFINRELTNWKLYAYKNSNYLRTPGSYTMIGRDCWWRRLASQGGFGCTFCSWTSTFPQWRVGSAQRLLDEIGQLIRLGVREVFDDTGTFPIGPWLKDFCEGMIQRGYNKKIYFGCNMRPNAIQDQETYNLMGRAGFRFILYGLESANQKSLDRLNKGEKEGDIIQAVKMAKRAGLAPHVTCMVGYPWETKDEAKKTIDLTRWLFKQGYIDTLQATIVIPYPGTAFFQEAKENGWLKTLDWDRYDMREPILKTEMPDEEILALTRGLFKTIFTPQFIFRKLKEGLSSRDKFKTYIWFTIKFFSKLLDFRGNSRGKHDDKKTV